MNERIVALDVGDRRIGIAVKSLEEATPVVGRFIDYSRRIVAQLHA